MITIVKFKFVVLQETIETDLNIMQFIKTFLASLTALVIFSLICLIGFLTYVGSLTAEPVVDVSDNTLLKLNLNKIITEQTVENPLADLGIGETANIGLLDLIKTINHAKDDENIKGLLVEPGYMVAGYSAIEEIRDALLDFRNSGKFVVSYADIYPEINYYLASSADEVYLGPEGFIEFNGMSGSVVFLKGLLDKLDIEAQIFRVGEFKSAVEPFIREDMSEENKLQITELLESINSHILAGVSESRGIELEKLATISDQMEVRNDKDALDMGLIDGLFYKDQLQSRLEELMGEDDFNIIGYTDYLKTTNSYNRASNGIALIVAEGDIVGGDDNENIAGGRFARMIRKVREDSTIKAVVFRINSPGGELQASDLIWREIQLTSEIKPVVASFSDYAASGGYYIGVAANTIVSEPTSITGSIGIFGIVFNFGNMLDNKIGITFDDVGTGEYSTMYTSTRSLTESEKTIIHKQVENGYNTFLSKVAAGRNMTIEEVEKIASGRVWSGTQAKEIGLVDELGGIDKALAIAAEKADLKDYRLYVYPKKKDIFEKILNQNVSNEEELGLKYFGESYYILKSVKDMTRQEGIQARMPFEIKMN